MKRRRFGSATSYSDYLRLQRGSQTPEIPAEEPKETVPLLALPELDGSLQDNL